MKMIYSSHALQNKENSGLFLKILQILQVSGITRPFPLLIIFSADVFISLRMKSSTIFILPRFLETY